MIMYFLSFMVVFSFVDWFMIWLGMEMNMFSFVGMMYDSNSWKNVESLMSYFFVQGLSSGIFLVMIFLGSGLEIPLMMSMAAGPFFFWLPGVMMGLTWTGCFFIMTFQSMIPLMLLSGMVSGISVFWGLLGMIMGVVGSYNQQVIKVLMAYSSVNHVGWMMVSQVVSGGLWIFYFLVYFFLVGMVFIWLSEGNVENLNEGEWGKEFMLFVVVMSMAGLPPFVGFVGSWMVLEFMIGESLMIGIMMIVSSLVMVYVYARMVYGMMMSSKCSDSFFCELGMDSYGNFLVVSLIGSLMLPFVFWVFMY
uniref:NADH dehydrogenase subunit 2 n=1 Tax=Brachypelma albiceps TaxID=1750704 RepID=UPI001FF21460|nr:NADH dehydrogenase subunit 2 [Brachypelma albiceps]UIO59255.1 NADH dehydrogenase subunit 2 [Brachypelma albiceps]